MLDGSSIASILGAGAIGLGFLLAYLTYRLLQKERQDNKPIYVYEFFCFALVIVGALLQYSSTSYSGKAETLEIRNKTLQGEANTAQESLSATQAELQTVKTNLDITLRRVQSAEASLNASSQVMTRIANMIPTAIKELGDINNTLTGNVCEGGPSGIPIWGGRGTQAASRNTKVMTDLAAAKSAIDGVLPQK